MTGLPELFGYPSWRIPPNEQEQVDMASQLLEDRHFLGSSDRLV